MDKEIVRDTSSTEKYRPGRQVAYIPFHAEEDLEHPDVEFGFITSTLGHVAFCRYWSKEDPTVLRTTANSEATSMLCLVLYGEHDQAIIDKLIAEIEKKGPIVSQDFVKALFEKGAS